MFAAVRDPVRRPGRARLGAAGAGLFLAGWAPVAAATTSPTEPGPEPEPVPPAVLAQQVIVLTAGDYSWVVDADGFAGVSPAGAPVTFVVGTGGPFIVTDEAGVVRYRLAAGEVALLTVPFAATPVEGDGAAELLAVSLVPGGETPFPVDDGHYDAEVLRAELDPAEVADLADPGPVPMLLLAPEGGLIVTGEAVAAAGEPDGVELGLGAHRPFEGSLTVINAGIDDVTVLAARLTLVEAAAAGPAAPATAATPTAAVPTAVSSPASSES